MKAKLISVSNFGGGDALHGLTRLIQPLKKYKIAIIETACLGIPKLSYLLPHAEISGLEKSKSMDQLIMDIERKELKVLSDYMVNYNDIDYLMVNPKSLPEAPVIRKLESNQSLIQIPFLVEKQLRDNYDYVFFLTQGRLINPMTHFSIRAADAVILYSKESYDFVQNYTHYKKLQEVFGIPTERLGMLVEDPNIRIEGVKIYSKEKDLLKLYKYIDDLSPTKGATDYLIKGRQANTEVVRGNESVGIIDPLEYIDYHVKLTQTDDQFSQTDAEKIDMLLQSIRQALIKEHLDEYVNSLIDEHARQKVRYYIADMIREQTEYQFNASINSVIEWVQKEITELGVLQEVLDDPEISSIEVNSPENTIVERNGIDEVANIKFRNQEHLRQTLDKILMPLGKPISSTEPIIDANYRGFRVCVVADNVQYQGVSSGSPLLSIRKFPPNVYTHEECIAYGNLSQEMIDFFYVVIPSMANVATVGGTNSGKTSTQIRYPLFVPKITRIISAEDSEEMRLAYKLAYADYPNLPSLLVKETEDEGKSYGMAKLIKTCLRLRPQVICIGEIRDEEAAKQALIAANTGHAVWTTIHANSAKEGATRFLQLNGNTAAAASQLASTFDIFVFQKKMPSGKRVITEISELIGYKGNEEPILNQIFKYDTRKNVHQRVGSIKSESLIEKMIMSDTAPEVMKHWCEVSE